MKTLILTLLTAFTLQAKAQFSAYDINEPFGWCTCKDYKTTGYNITGGNATTSKKTTTLTATGSDQGKAIQTAIKNYDIIILDGSKGDFKFSTAVSLSSLSNKTIVGINNARLCTMFYITPEIKGLLDDAHVSSASTSSGTGGTLPNGTNVSEEREYLTRLTLINAGYDDKQVNGAGIFSMSSCKNIIMRNIKFVGPGPIDVGGKDLLTISGGNNIWVDHCDFTDGIDGNFDINNAADLITVSWCTFSYTDRAYDHMNSNLIGGSDSQAKGQNKHNVTYANCMWGNRCKQRMPMARNGIIHLINDYYNCPGNNVAINPRYGSNFIVEGISAAPNVAMFSQTDAYSCYFSNGYYENDFNEKSSSCNFGTKVNIPYKYTVQDATLVADFVSTYAGATLTSPLSIGRDYTGMHIMRVPEINQHNKTFNIFGQQVDNTHKGLIIRNGKKYINR